MVSFSVLFWDGWLSQLLLEFQWLGRTKIIPEYSHHGDSLNFRHHTIFFLIWTPPLDGWTVLSGGMLGQETFNTALYRMNCLHHCWSGTSDGLHCCNVLYTTIKCFSNHAYWDSSHFYDLCQCSVVTICLGTGVAIALAIAIRSAGDMKKHGAAGTHNWLAYPPNI